MRRGQRRRLAEDADIIDEEGVAYRVKGLLYRLVVGVAVALHLG
jgi:hypothetical protein